MSSNSGASVEEDRASDVSKMVQRIIDSLVARRFRFSNEAVLHESIAKVLDDDDINVKHEVVAGPRDRFDFLAPDGVVVEVKIKGSFSEAVRQVARYLDREDVSAVVLVTSRPWGRESAGSHLLDNGKRFYVAHLRGQSF